MIELKMINGEIVAKEITTFAKTSLEITPITASAERAELCELSRTYDKRMQRELDLEAFKAAFKKEIIDCTIGFVVLVTTLSLALFFGSLMC